MHRDESVFNKPNEFNPARFVGEKGRSNIKYLTTFGTMCPGRFITNNMLLITMAYIIQYDVCFKVDGVTAQFLNPKNAANGIPLSGAWSIKKQ